MTRKRSRVKAPAEALLTAAQRRVVIALNAERMRMIEAMGEVMEALREVGQAAGMVGEGPWDFEQRDEGMFVVLAAAPPQPPSKSGGGEEQGSGGAEAEGEGSS